MNSEAGDSSLSHAKLRRFTELSRDRMAGIALQARESRVGVVFVLQERECLLAGVALGRSARIVSSLTSKSWQSLSAEPSDG